MLSCFGHALKTNSTLVSPDVLAHQGAFWKINFAAGNTHVVCVCVFRCVRRCQQVSEITTGLLSDPCKWLTCHSNLQAPPLLYQHHRLSVEYSGVWIVSRTHTLTHMHAHNSAQCFYPTTDQASKFTLLLSSPRPRFNLELFTLRYDFQIRI